MQEVVPLHTKEQAPEAKDRVTAEAKADREQAEALVDQLPKKADTGRLAAALLNQTLIDLINGPAIPVRYAPKLIETVHQVMRLEAGEATQITREEMVATVESLRKKAQDSIAAEGA